MKSPGCAISLNMSVANILITRFGAIQLDVLFDFLMLKYVIPRTYILRSDICPNHYEEIIMRGITKLSVLSLSLVVLSGCWLDDDDNDTTTVTPPDEPEVRTYMRVHHTSADAPNVNVLVDGNAVLEDVLPCVIHCTGT